MIKIIKSAYFYSNFIESYNDISNLKDRMLDGEENEI